jgi:hypothetical protein
MPTVIAAIELDVRLQDSLSTLSPVLSSVSTVSDSSIGDAADVQYTTCHARRQTGCIFEII